jgi:hypothetical protein
MNPAQTDLKDRKALATVAAVAGILCFTVLPLAVTQAMDAVLKGAAIKIPASGNPLIATAPRIVLTFFPVWEGLSVTAGVALLLVAWGIYRGEPWARPVAIGLLAIPSITGAYLSGPVMFFAKSAMPLFLIVALIGLVPYFTLLLWGRDSLGRKAGTFFLFLMLGVTAAWSFSNGGSSLRMFWARPEAYVLSSGDYGFLMGIPVVWSGVVSTIVAIPLLAGSKRAGWRLGLVGLVTSLVGSTILFITHPGTKEFLIGMIMAVVTSTLLFLPSTRSKVEAGNM